MRGSLRKRIENIEQAVYGKERLKEVMALAQEQVKAMLAVTYQRPPEEYTEGREPTCETSGCDGEVSRGKLQ